jgi:hypothetical protein
MYRYERMQEEALRERKAERNMYLACYRTNPLLRRRAKL